MLLPSILLNSVSCGADGLLGGAHDAAHGLIVHAHFVEDEAISLPGYSTLHVHDANAALQRATEFDSSHNYKF